MSANPAKALATVCVATAMLMLDIAVINTALPRVASDLHATLAGVEWIVDAYTLALAAIVLTAGSLADRFGRRRTFVIGLLIFTVSSLACAIATSMIELDIARAVQGVGAAAMFSTSLALLGDAFPDPGARAKALAAYGATIGASFAVGPLVGGALTSWFGWRSVFLVNLPIGAWCIFAAWTLAESKDPRPRRPDWIGQLLAGGALFLVVFALLRGNVVGWTATATIAQFVGAGALATAFVVSQAVNREPMLPLSMFANRTFTGLQVTAFAISASFFAMFVYTTFYLQSVLGLSPIQAGLIYMPGTIAMLLVSGATSAMLDRVDAKPLLIGGLALVAVGLALCLVLDADSAWWAMLPGLIVGLIGCGVVNPVLSGLVLGESADGQQALSVGINDAARQTGIALGVAVLGAFVPTSTSTATGGAAGFVSGLHDALWVAIAICAAGAVLGAFLVRGSKPAQQPLIGTPVREPVPA